MTHKLVAILLIITMMITCLSVVPVSAESKDFLLSEAGEYNGHLYYVFRNNDFGWDDAKRYCESLGAHLATISSREENEYVYQYITSKGYQSAFIGLFYEDTENNWKWVTKEDTTFINWAPGEPNSDRENYAMFYYKYTDGTWNDGNLSTTQNTEHVFICEWEDYDSFHSASEKIRVERSELISAVLNEATKYNNHKYYVFRNNSFSWQDAREYCASLGGHLATITSQDENDFIYRYITGCGYQTAYFGLIDENKDGRWKWVTNEAVDYTNWHPGEPSSRKENLGMFYYKFTDGTWNDGNLSSAQNKDGVFICEWDDYNNDEQETSAVVSEPAATNQENWQQAYYDFIINKGYKTSGQEFLCLTDPAFALHDLNGDGTPELLAFNGGDCHANGETFAYYAKDGTAQYAGRIGGDIYSDVLYYYEGSSYPGVFFGGGGGGYSTVDYRTIQDGQIVIENVREYGTDYINDKFVDFDKKTTSDNELYQLACREEGQQIIRFTEESAMDWESFIASWSNAAISAEQTDAASAQARVSDEPSVALTPPPIDVTAQGVVAAGSAGIQVKMAELIAERPNGVWAEYYQYSDKNDAFTDANKRWEFGCTKDWEPFPLSDYGLIQTIDFKWNEAKFANIYGLETTKYDGSGKDYPVKYLKREKFAALFNGYVVIQESGEYTFRLKGDDGISLSMPYYKADNSVQELGGDAWGASLFSERELNSPTVYLETGTILPLTIKYKNDNGQARLQFSYKKDNGEYTVVGNDDIITLRMGERQNHVDRSWITTKEDLMDIDAKVSKAFDSMANEVLGAFCEDIFDDTIASSLLPDWDEDEIVGWHGKLVTTLYDAAVEKALDAICFALIEYPLTSEQLAKMTPEEKLERLLEEVPYLKAADESGSGEYKNIEIDKDALKKDALQTIVNIVFVVMKEDQNAYPSLKGRLDEIKMYENMDPSAAHETIGNAIIDFIKKDSTAAKLVDFLKKNLEEAAKVKDTNLFRSYLTLDYFENYETIVFSADSYQYGPLYRLIAQWAGMNPGGVSIRYDIPSQGVTPTVAGGIKIINPIDVLGSISDFHFQNFFNEYVNKLGEEFFYKSLLLDTVGMAKLVYKEVLPVGN